LDSGDWLLGVAQNVKINIVAKKVNRVRSLFIGLNIKVVSHQYTKAKIKTMYEVDLTGY
jgi:hypothetical protein